MRKNRGGKEYGQGICGYRKYAKMDIIKEMRLRSKNRQKLILLPEKDDPRIKEAAKIIQKEGISRIALLGKEDLEQKKIEQFAQVFFESRKHKGITFEDARSAVSLPLYYAAMMVRLGEADGFVAGASHSTPDVARAAIYCLGVDPKINIVSSCFVMVVPDCSFGENGIFIFADCGIVPEPNAKQLAGIAISSGIGRKLICYYPQGGDVKLFHQRLG